MTRITKAFWACPESPGTINHLEYRVGKRYKFRRRSGQLDSTQASLLDEMIDSEIAATEDEPAQLLARCEVLWRSGKSRNARRFRNTCHARSLITSDTARIARAVAQ